MSRKRELLIKEHIEEISDGYGESNIFVTDNVYEAKTKILSTNKGLRIFIQKNIPLYLIGDMYYTTHIDMIEQINNYGYDIDYDAYDDDQICLLYNPYPNNENFIEGEAICDNYYTRYMYNRFDIWSELDKDFTQFELSEILGEIEDIIDYSEYYQEEDSEILNEQLLLELNRGQLINKSKKSDNYKDQSKGKNRWDRRTKSRIDTQVAQYNKINMNDFFKDDELKVGINVHGETNDYTVLIRYKGVLRELQEQVKRNNNRLEFKCVLIALQRIFNSENVFVSCTCLHPDTKIKLLDGTVPTVAEMKNRFDSGEQLYVYSTDNNGDFKPGIVEKVWITKKESDLVKITIDNNEQIITTLDHPYMLRNGSYKLAENLAIGDSLMPMYLTNDNKGYQRVKFNSEKRGWHSVYKLVADYFKKSDIKEAKLRVTPDDNMGYDIAIHHKDFNKNNNNPENLQIMTAREHWDYHASLCGKDRPISDRLREVSRNNAIKRNANPTERMLECRKAFIEKGLENARFRNHDPECLKKQAELMRVTVRNYYKNLSKEDKEHMRIVRSKNTSNAHAKGCYKTEAFMKAAKERGKNMHTPDRENLSRLGVINYYSNPINKENHKIKTLETKIKNILYILLENNLDLTDDNYEKIRKTLNGYPKVTKRFKDINEAISYFNINHKITNIEYIHLDTPIDVYDIKVKDWENFVVDAGIVLHNCPDFRFRQAYYATKDGYNSGIPEIRPSDITNPNDTKGAGCKHINLILGNVDWIMKVASVINNYIHYMEEHMQRKYADLMFPKIYGIPYNKAVQLNLFDQDNELYSSEEDIKLSNKYGRDRTKFRSDVRINNMKNFKGKEPFKTDPDTPKLDLNMTRKMDEIKNKLSDKEDNIETEKL